MKFIKCLIREYFRGGERGIFALWRPYPINSGCPLFTLSGNLLSNFSPNARPLHYRELRSNPPFFFVGGERGICFSRASRKIVHWTIFSPKANTQTKVCWLLIQIPHHTQTKNLKQTLVRFRFYVAEKEGFEPSLRLSHTTPLAGEPLRPLGYFSEYLILFI